MTVHIDNHPITNTLIDLGEAINVMTKDLFISLGLHGLRPTPTVLELVDRSRVKPEGMIEDVVITVASWNYLADFLILQTKSNLGGHPLILGRPWLATADAYIRCRSGSMVISDGQATKHLNLYPPSKPYMGSNSTWWDEFVLESDLSLPLLMLGKAQYFKDETEDDIINGFISNSLPVASIRYLGEEGEEDDVIIEHLKTTPLTISSPIEIEPGKCLNINPNLIVEQSILLIHLL